MAYGSARQQEKRQTIWQRQQTAAEHGSSFRQHIKTRFANGEQTMKSEAAWRSVADMPAGGNDDGGKQLCRAWTAAPWQPETSQLWLCRLALGWKNQADSQPDLATLAAANQWRTAAR